MSRARNRGMGHHLVMSPPALRTRRSPIAQRHCHHRHHQHHPWPLSARLHRAECRCMQAGPGRALDRANRAGRQAGRQLTQSARRHRALPLPEIKYNQMKCQLCSPSPSVSRVSARQSTACMYAVSQWPCGAGRGCATPLDKSMSAVFFFCFFWAAPEPAGRAQDEDRSQTALQQQQRPSGWVGDRVTRRRHTRPRRPRTPRTPRTPPTPPTPRPFRCSRRYRRWLYLYRQCRRSQSRRVAVRRGTKTRRVSRPDTLAAAGQTKQ